MSFDPITLAMAGKTIDMRKFQTLSGNSVAEIILYLTSQGGGRMNGVIEEAVRNDLFQAFSTTKPITVTLMGDANGSTVYVRDVASVQSKSGFVTQVTFKALLYNAELGGYLDIMVSLFRGGDIEVKINILS